MKLWQISSQTSHPLIEAYTVGNDYEFDQELLPYDIKASIAHVKMLGKIGILKSMEVKKLVTGLQEILKLRSLKKFPISIAQEDGHTAIEDYLTKKLGTLGKKIHTARSRNDQILVTLRLYTLDKGKEIKKSVQKLSKALGTKIKEVGKQKMPGYTHTQRAMPTTVGVWLGSYVDALQDDLVLLDAALQVNNQNPLGSAAGFGNNIIPLDRAFTAKELGFQKVQENPIYCGSSRGKFENMVLQALTNLMLDIGKCSNELIWFTTQEFNFFDLPDSFKTGSSIMPQKHNFDVLELLRGNVSLFLGYQYQVQEIIKNLFAGYNRDLQLTKEPYLKAVALCQKSIEVFTLCIENLKVNKEVLDRACTPEIYATDKAYSLVKEKGVAFREAYQSVKSNM